MAPSFQSQVERRTRRSPFSHWISTSELIAFLWGDEGRVRSGVKADAPNTTTATVYTTNTTITGGDKVTTTSTITITMTITITT